MKIRLTDGLFSRASCAGISLLIYCHTQGQNLFVSDVGGTNVYEFTPGGTQSIFASVPGTPSGLAFNRAGDLFVADAAAGNVYEFTPNGTRTIFTSGLSQPTGLAFNRAGDLFVADQGSGSIYKFTPDGTQTTFASGLTDPNGLAFNSTGDLFEADWISGYIYEFTTNGTRTTFASEGVFYDPVIAPFALAFDGAGNLFVGNDVTTSHYIVEFTPDGASSTFVSSGLTTACGLAFNSVGDLFEADWGSGNIYKFTSDGKRTTFASGLVHPIALAFQPTPELAAIVTNGIFQVTVSMPSPYQSTIIQASMDIVNWVNIYTNTPPFTFTDSLATNLPCRYYRALLGP